MSNRFPLPGLSIRDILVNRLEIRRMQMARCIPIRQNDLSHLWLGIEPAETKRPKKYPCLAWTDLEVLLLQGQDASHHLAREDGAYSIPLCFKPYFQVCGIEDLHLRICPGEMNPLLPLQSPYGDEVAPR